jgi:hypothetical protein
MKHLLVVICCVALLSFKQSSESTKSVSLEFTSKILEKGKYVSVQGELYYDIVAKKMTTRITKPVENITIVKVNGEMKIYDPKENTILDNTSTVNSTETSYFHRFFNNEASDMGLQKLGYLIQSTKIDEGLLVTTWAPKPGTANPLKSIELAHQKSKIVYMGLISHKNKYVGKIYFSKYFTVGSISLPGSITEFGYTEKGDSIINKKNYFNGKINNQVNLNYLNYQIPENARVINTPTISLPKK